MMKHLPSDCTTIYKTKECGAGLHLMICDQESLFVKALMKLFIGKTSCCSFSLSTQSQVDGSAMRWKLRSPVKYASCAKSFSPSALTMLYSAVLLLGLSACETCD